MSVIRVQGLTKLYRRMVPGAQLRTLKSALLDGNLTRGLRQDEAIRALSDVSFEVGRGEAFGVVGGNGSGKSTLLKIVAGILQPTEGSVEVDGRLAALIELGAGFHPEISGRENLYINGTLLGLSRKELDHRYDDIVEFSGLGEFMEEPVKNYSSGMYVRLGFAVAVHTDPDVLLVDEVLAVGDEAFAHRCLRRIEEMLSKGATVLFVSHSLDLVLDLCDRVLWLDRGVPRELGEPRRVVDAYRHSVAQAEGRMHQEDKARVQGAAGVDGDEGRRWGSREAEIVGVTLRGSDGDERYLFTSGEALEIEIQARATAPLNDFVFGVNIATPRGVDCWGTNTELAGFVPERMDGDVRVCVRCPALRLAAGEYRLDVAVHARDGAPYDYREGVLGFTVEASRKSAGIYAPEHAWTFDGGVAWK